MAVDGDHDHKLVEPKILPSTHETPRYELDHASSPGLMYLYLRRDMKILRPNLLFPLIQDEQTAVVFPFIGQSRRNWVIFYNATFEAVVCLFFKQFVDNLSPVVIDFTEETAAKSI